MDCLTSFENSLLLDVTSPYTHSADKKPVFNEGKRAYTPEFCHDFATTFVRCAAGVIAHVSRLRSFHLLLISLVALVQALSALIQR